MKQKRALVLWGLSGEFAVDLKAKKIFGDKNISNRLSLYKVLHECGHLSIFNIPIDDWVSMSFDQICEEIMAWKYAKNCVKPEYWDELEELAVGCISSHARYCICPKFFTEDLLYFMLQWGDKGEKPKQHYDILHILSLSLLEWLPSYYWKIIKIVRIIGICVKELVHYALHGPKSLGNHEHGF